MTTKERFTGVLEWFSINNPLPKTELQYESPFQLLVSVILSAQCTDVRVNKITPALFSRFPEPQSMAEASTEEIFELIKSCSYPNNKTSHLSSLSKILMDKYQGNIPSEVEELVKLPGVGRKTAHVFASVVHHQEVLAVDTHVFRVSERIGLTTKSKNPLDTERQLVKHIPGKMIPDAHHWLILHGRHVCKARRPLCSQCGIQQWCRYVTSQKSLF
jgi:endonuclease-3